MDAEPAPSLLTVAVAMGGGGVAAADAVAVAMGGGGVAASADAVAAEAAAVEAALCRRGAVGAGAKTAAGEGRFLRRCSRACQL